MTGNEIEEGNALLDERNPYAMNEEDLMFFSRWVVDLRAKALREWKGLSPEEDRELGYDHYKLVRRLNGVLTDIDDCEAFFRVTLKKALLADGGPCDRKGC